MNEIIKHINDTNASYRDTSAGDAKNTDLFLDNEHYALFEGCGDQVKVRFDKENLSKAILFIASILPRKYDNSSVHKKIQYSASFVLEQLAILDAVFTENGLPVEKKIQTWNARKDVPQKNGKIDTRFYFNGLIEDITYKFNGSIEKGKFTIRNYVAGGYSDLHIRKSEDGIFDVRVTNVLEPFDDGKEKDIKEDIDISSSVKSLQQIFYGAPGTGKSHTINHTTAGEDVIRTTFHPDTDYSTFVGAYKPTTIEETVMTVIGTKAVPVENADGTLRKESKIIYEFVAQAFLQAYVKAWKKVAEAEGEPKKQFLVIEEINRGNCAQIFGDLFQLLDRNDSGFSDYPIQADADMKRQLQKAFNGMELTNKEALNSLYEGRNVAEEVINGDILLLPSNLYIWGTMNTSDQSLFPIDSAFKRRWDWTYMPISNAYKEWTIKVGNDNYDWWSFLESINDKIGSTTNSEDKKLGYFFCKAQNDVISVEKFVGKVIFYLWNDVFKDYEFCDAIFNDEDGSKLTFAKFYTEEGRNARIVTDKVAVFLKNLGLEPSFIEPDAETNSVPNSESGSQMDYSKYSLNGEGSYSKGGLVYEAVKRYATAHAESTADEIVNTWLRLGINVPYLVETVEEHEQRKQQTSDSRFDQKSKMLELPNHEVIYISNQFNVQRIEDFIEKVNAQPWHLTLAKI